MSKIRVMVICFISWFLLNAGVVYVIEKDHDDYSFDDFLSCYIDGDFQALLQNSDSLMVTDSSATIYIATLRAWSFFYLNDYMNAIREVDIAESAYGDILLDMTLVRLYSYRMLKRGDQIEQLEAKISENVHDVIGLSMRAGYYYFTERTDKTIEDCKMISNIYGDQYFTPYILLTLAYFDKNDLESAAKALNDANNIVLESKHGELSSEKVLSSLHCVYTLYYHMIGDYNNALNHYKLAHGYGEMSDKLWLVFMYIELKDNMMGILKKYSLE